MAGGLIALLDDVAALAKLAAASVDDVGAAAGRASAKAAGVVVDDTAVTPRYVTGFAPERELPIIRRIAVGSLRNKLLFILPAALVLSQFAPWLLSPLLMLGGAYLCFEGAEKIYEALAGHGHSDTDAPVVARDDAEVAAVEQQMVKGAIRTDFILSAEIMVISLYEVATQPLVQRAAVLIVVALLITALVYGVVALIVKMDDIGLRLAERGGSTAGLGRGLVRGMPILLRVLAVVGTAAMLWVGGHIIVDGLRRMGWTGPYDVVHAIESAVAGVAGPLSGLAGWLANTVASLAIGAAIGAVIVVLIHQIHRLRHRPAAAA